MVKKAKAKAGPAKCACGNFAGDDGFCNACRDKQVNGSTQPRTLAGTIAGKSRAAASKGKKTRSDLAREAVLQGCPPSVGPDIVEHLAEFAATAFEDTDADRETLMEELKNTFLPLLQEYEVPDDDAIALVQQVEQEAFRDESSGQPQSSEGHQSANGAANLLSQQSADDSTDALFRVSNLMLMYGGSPEPLLRNATLELLRGHRYGVIGTNGSGKTTLMARVAGKNIAGIPESLRVVHLRHEAILQGVARQTTAREYARQRAGSNAEASDQAIDQALLDVGFDSEELLEQRVLALSGGWQMRLALACAMAQRANLYLLDEPTNHLDVAGVKWLAEFVTRSNAGDACSTAMIVSHDPDFLDEVCTDIIHFAANGKLNYHPGNFNNFKAKELGGDEAKARMLLETAAASTSLGVGPAEVDRMLWPAVEKLGETSASRSVPVVTLRKASYQYKGAAAPVLENVNIDLLANSKVGIVGKNGSGKSTLLSLMAGRLKAPAVDSSSFSEVSWHKGLRLAYIAQHALVHLGEYMEHTPKEYVQLRFRKGFDFETPVLQTPPPSKDEQKKLRAAGQRQGKHGRAVEAIVQRTEYGEGKERVALYEVKWDGLSPAENSIEKRSRLVQLGAERMVNEFDERLWSVWAGQQPRPLTDREIIGHLERFGLSEDVITNRKIAMLSSGQKTKLAFGAALWTRPHVVCLDEPTNYLDMESVEMLQRAAKGFKGACAVVTHSEKFVQEVCNEVWEVEDGKITTRKMSGP